MVMDIGKEPVREVAEDNGISREVSLAGNGRVGECLAGTNDDRGRDSVACATRPRDRCLSRIVVPEVITPNAIRSGDMDRGDDVEPIRITFERTS